MNIIMRSHYIYKKIWCWYRKAWKPKSIFPVPFFTRIVYALRGFSANEYIWYDLKNNDYHNYISEYERVFSRNINGDYRLILDDKLVFEEIFRNLVKVPSIYAWISHGTIYGLHGYAVDNENIVRFLEEKKELVIKWETGYEGKGTYVIRIDEEGCCYINGKKGKKEDIINILPNHDRAIICEFMHQSAFEQELYSESTNTLRIICAKKKGQGKANIIRAVQRIGTNTSKPVDNVSAGALAAPVDLETGVLGSAILAKGHDKNGIKIKYDIHPDTGAKICGQIIPNWENIKKKIEEITNKFPYLNFIAWDVLLTDDGICIIEGNASAGLMMFQAEQGERNSEIGEIYKSYGIIK